MSHQDTASSPLSSLSANRLTWTIYALVIGAVSALFFADLRHLLLGVDDAGTFRNHGAINEDFLFFFSPEKERASGRIVDEFIMWGVHLIAGNNLAVFHLLIAFAHGLASLSLAVCFRRLGIGTAASLIGGLLFLINIAHVETVHWISALEYPMAVLNSAWTLYFFSRYVESERRIFYGLFCAGLTLCILTHFVAVLLWPLCLFYAFSNSTNFRGHARYLFFVLPVIALALAFVFAITGNDTTTKSAFSFYHESTSQFAGVLSFTSDGLQAYLWLLGRLISMAHWLPFSPNIEHSTEAWLGGLVLIVLLVLLWKANSSIQFFCAWTLLFLLPFVPAVLVHTGIARYIYIATAGSSLLLAWALSWLAKKMGQKGSYTLALALLLIVWSSYRAEERMANITRYNSGRYYITNDDPQIGIDLLQKTLATDTAFVSLGEAYLSLLEGLLISGQDYEGVLEAALEAAPEDGNIGLLERISNIVMDPADRVADPEVLALLYGASYWYVDSGFLHTTSILSQHFGIWYSKRGDYDGAIRSYRLSLRADPENVNTARSLIEILFLRGNYSDAEETVEAFKFHQTENPHLLYLTALSYQYAGRLQDALAMVHRAQQLTRSANLHILEGDLLLEKGLMAEAEAAYRRAIAAESTSPEPFLQIAYIYCQEGRVDLALRTLEDAPSPMQKHAIIQNELGRLYDGEGRAEDAVAAYQRAIVIDPNYILAYSNLGTVFRSLGRLGESEQAYRRALALDQNNSPTHTQLGSLLYVQGKYREAIGHYSIALERDPNATTQFNLGLAHMARGDFSTARRVYAQGIARFGAEEAQRIGAVASLRALEQKRPSALEIRQLLDEFWPQ